MNIKKVVFNNFRNYKNRHEFQLENQINILFGENGNGKSSFFDGLEWCLIGAVSRFSSIKKDVKGKRAVANKDIQINEECFVEIYFENFFLKRSFKLNKNGFGSIIFNMYAKISDDNFKKVATGEEKVDLFLKKMVSETEIKDNDTKKSIGEGIKKAYILSQDQVTDFISKSIPEDRYSSLSSIMGFDNIIKFRNKVLVLKKILKNNENNISDKILNLKHQKNSFEKLLRIEDKSIQKEYEEKNNDFQYDTNSIINKINEIKKESHHIHNSIETINSFIDFDLNSVEDILNTESLLNQEIKENNKKMKILQDNLNEKQIEKNNLVSILKESRGVNKKNTLYNKQVNLAKEIIFELELDGMNVNGMDEEKLNLEMNKISKEAKKAEFAMKNLKKYNLSKKEISSITNEIKENKIKIDVDEKKFNNLEKERSILEKSFVNAQDFSDIQTLINNMEGVLSYITNNNVDNTCPVCSSETKQPLSKVISKNILNLTNVTQTFKEDLNEKIKRNNYIRYEIISLNNTIIKNKLITQNLEVGLKEASNFLDNIEVHKLYSAYFNFSNIEIKNFSEECNRKLRNLSELKFILSDIKLKKIDSNVNAIHITNRLDEKNLKNKINEFKDSIKKIADELYKISKIQDQNKIKLYKLNEAKNSYNEVFGYYDIYFKKDLLDYFTFKEIENQNHIELLQKILPQIEIKNFNFDIYKRIENIEKVIKENSDIKNSLFKKKKLIEESLFLIDSEYGKEASDFLNSKDSDIQLYYKYLNPTPSKFNELNFEITENRKLEIKVSELKNKGRDSRKFTGNAETVLSSGQLNVLALAIFIATNKAQTGMKFNFIAIDDPIQNMDDVNRFSICDVLSSINRQLIFSTHDQDFLNLFLKKNEHNLDNIAVFILNAEKNEYNKLDFN